MGSFSKAVPVADAGVGKDLATNESWVMEAAKHRRVLGFALVGANAVAECKVNLYAGDRLLGSFYNTTSGAAKVPVENDKKHVMGAFVPMGKAIRLIVETAPSVNQIVYDIDIVPAGQGGFQRQQYGQFTGFQPRY